MICVLETPLGYGFYTGGQLIPELEFLNPNYEKVYVVSEDLYQIYRGGIIPVYRIVKTNFWWLPDDERVALTIRIAKKISKMIQKPLYVEYTIREKGAIYVGVRLPTYEVEIEKDVYISQNNVYLHRVMMPFDANIPIYVDDDMLFLRNVKIICNRFESITSKHVGEHHVLFRSTLDTRFLDKPIPEGYWLAYIIVR